MENSELETIFRRINSAHLRTWMSEDSPLFEPTLAFVVSRFRAGLDLLSVLRTFYDQSYDHERRARVLDIGSGNGGVILPFANERSLECHALDLFVHAELKQVLDATGVPLHVAVANGESLPYHDSTFSLVLYIDTIEHVDRPRELGAEISRILKPGGLCFITTPPRMSFLLKPDPHYHTRGLLLLPNSMQRWVVERITRRGTRYDVTHIFWSVWGVMRQMPGLRVNRVFSQYPGRIGRQLAWSLIVGRKDNGPRNHRGAVGRNQRAAPNAADEPRPRQRCS